jgi:ketosteroid isomerase-like protein
LDETRYCRFAWKAAVRREILGARCRRRNVDLVRRGYEYFARTGETDPSVYAPDIEWHSAVEDPGQEVFHGIEGVNRLIAEVQEAIDDFRTEPFEFLDAGDKVVARLIHRGGGTGSSAVEMQEWNVFLIRGGRIASVHEYSEREEALEAAGLRE